MAKASKIVIDIGSIVELRKAIEGANLHMGDFVIVPVSKDRFPERVVKAIVKAIQEEVVAAIPPATLKANVLTNLQNKIAAIEAQYPGLTIEEG